MGGGTRNAQKSSLTQPKWCPLSVCTKGRWVGGETAFACLLVLPKKGFINITTRSWLPMQTCRHESCKQRDRLQPSPATRLSWRCISAPIEDRVLPPVLSPECRSVNWSISLANSRASSGCRSEVGRMGEKKVEAQGNARNFRPDCKSPNQSAPPILTVHCKATSIKCNPVKAHYRKHQESCILEQCQRQCS